MDTIITETPGLSSDKISINVTENVSSPKTSFEFGNILRWIFIILILAFLGFNIFTYLGKATDETTHFLSPIIKSITTFFATLFGETTKSVVNVSAKGVKLGTDVAAGTVTSGIDVLEKTLTGKEIRNKIDDNSTDTVTNSITTDVDIETDTDSDNESDNMPIAPKINNVKPISTASIPSAGISGKTTQSKPSSKSGWCFVGEDRGFRSCVSVNESQTCMSGDIFPTRDICINPGLRE